MTSSFSQIEKKLNVEQHKSAVTDTDTIHVIKLEDFEEYPVIRENNDVIDLLTLPSINIQPLRRDPRVDQIPDDPIFTKEYFLKTASILEENGYFARGDNRSPDTMGGEILPKCHSPQINPHYDVERHRHSSDCSGFVSLTDKMSVAHAFGQAYESGQSGYYVYIAEMERGIWMINPIYPGESEHTAIGSVPIISYRKCFSLGPSHDQCSSIFVKKDIPTALKKKLIEAQLLPSEKIKNTIRPDTQTFSNKKLQHTHSIESKNMSRPFPRMNASNTIAGNVMRGSFLPAEAFEGSIEKDKSRDHHNRETVGSTIMKAVNYGYHKKNEWMMQKFKDFPTLKKIGYAISGVEHLIDYSANLIEQKPTKKPAEHFEKAAIGTSVDFIWEKFIKKGPLLGVELAGSIGDFAVGRLDQKIDSMKKQDDHPLTSEQLNVLYEGKGFFELLRLGKFGLELLKHKAIDLYDYLKKPELNDKMSKALNNPLMNQYHLSHAKGLFQDLNPHGLKPLKKTGQYILSMVKKEDPTFSIDSSDALMRHPVFSNEVQKLNLTKDQLGFFTLYIGSEYDSIKELSGTPAKPSKHLIRENISTLEKNIREDLSEKNIEKSKIFNKIKEKTNDCYKWVGSTSSATSTSYLETKKAYEHEIQVEKLQKISQDISAVGQLGSQIANLTGNPRAARKISALTTGISSSLMAFSVMSANPIMGMVGLGSAVCSLFGFFDDGDDDDGLAEYLSNLHNDMIQGFNKVLNQQLELARGLSQQMSGQHQQVMGRFDHVDESLYLIQQTIVQGYKQLWQQQEYISRQIEGVSHQVAGLSRQLSDTERNIMMGLQTMHTNIMKNFQIIGEGLTYGFEHLNQQMTKGMSQLGTMNKELACQIAGHALKQEQLMQGLMQQQQESKELLHGHTEQFHGVYSRDVAKNHRDTIINKTVLINQLTEFAERVLGDFPMNQLTESKISKIHLALQKAADPILTGIADTLSNSAICDAIGRDGQWGDTNPFDVIDLLRMMALQSGFDESQQEKFKNPFVNMTVYQANISAYLKWIMHQDKIAEDKKEAVIEKLKNYAEQSRNILHFSHALSNEKVMNTLFKQAEKSANTLGESLENKLHSYEDDLSRVMQTDLRALLNKQEIEFTRLNKEEANEFDIMIASRKKAISELKSQIFDKISIPYSQPINIFVRPCSEKKNEEKTQFALLLTQDKMRPIPSVLLQLEALGVGTIDFQYRYINKQLIVTTEFHFSQSDTIVELDKINIDVEHENQILDAWKQFHIPSKEAIQLSAQKQTEMESLLNHKCKDLRIKYNEKLKGYLHSAEIQKEMESVEAHTGILHMYLKLLFNVPYQDHTHSVYKIAQSLLSSKVLEQYIMSYSGQITHPARLISEGSLTYQSFVDQLTRELQQKTLYVDNLALTNILMLIDQVILELLSPDQREKYLNEILQNSPESARAMTYFSRGLLNSASNVVGTLADYTSALELHPNDSLIRFRRADMLLLQGNWQKAVEDYSYIIDQTQQALKSIVEYEEKAPSNPLLKKLKETFYINLSAAFSCRADAYAMGQFYPAASGDYDSACELLPNHPDLLYKRAYNFECMCEYDLELMSNLPNNDQNQAEPGILYLSPAGTYVVRNPEGEIKTGSLKKSDMDLSDLTHRLNDAALRKSILEVTTKASYTRVGKHDLAQKDYEAILKVQDDHAMALEGLARCLVNQNQKEKAFEYYFKLQKRFSSISGLKLQCIKLAAPDDKHIEDWIEEVVNDKTTSTDDILYCAHLAAKLGLAIAQLAYDKVNDDISTREQCEICADINALFGNRKEYTFYKKHALSLNPTQMSSHLGPPKRYILYENDKIMKQPQSVFERGLFGKKQKIDVSNPVQTGMQHNHKHTI